MIARGPFAFFPAEPEEAAHSLTFAITGGYDPTTRHADVGWEQIRHVYS
jgi:hypothetical protein